MRTVSVAVPVRCGPREPGKRKTLQLQPWESWGRRGGGVGRRSRVPDQQGRV